MSEFLYCKRRATSVENERIRVIVTAEGGHIAAIIHKPTGVNPLWTPPWPSIEPSTYDRVQHAEYGTIDEAIVLSGSPSPGIRRRNAGARGGRYCTVHSPFRRGQD